jgi:hypothetical protein
MDRHIASTRVKAIVKKRQIDPGGKNLLYQLEQFFQYQGKSTNLVFLSTVNIQEITQVEVEMGERENTSDVGGENEDQACQ